MRYKIHIISISVILFFNACNSGNIPEKLNEIILPSVKGVDVKIFNENIPATAYIFMAPDCPLCINYSLVVREIEEKINSDDFKILLIFSGEYYSHDEIVEFLDIHKLEFESVWDKDHVVSKLLGASVTPEAILVDYSGNIAYKGAIDDWVYGLGLRKQIVTETYLLDAVNSVLNGDVPEKSFVKPFGCHLEI